MTHPIDILNLVIEPTLRTLGMDSARAQQMLLAIGLQESGFRVREQRGGPARGFWQFESIACLDFVERGLPACRERVQGLLCGAPFTASTLWTIVGGGADHIACILARDKLYREIAQPLPALDDEAEGWRQYVASWRPGKPHRDRWSTSWATARTLVEA